MKHHPVAMLLIVLTWAAACGGASPPVQPVAPELALPLRAGSVRFGVIGDSGTGGREQYEVAEQMMRYREVYPYDFVLMLGDNLYGSESPQDYRSKFEEPYRGLLQVGVRFHASLGNHDMPNQRFYELFNMNGQRYYAFSKGNVEFFALDSDYLDPNQMRWLESALRDSAADWKICYFHHPIYSSAGRHGSNTALRATLEPVFIRHGVDVVLQGHDHAYERLKPQAGIHYFVSGAAGKLRRGDVGPGSVLTEKAFDEDYHFMLVEIAGDEMFFQAIDRSGRTIDQGRIVRTEQERPARECCGDITARLSDRGGAGMRHTLDTQSGRR